MYTPLSDAEIYQLKDVDTQKKRMHEFYNQQEKAHHEIVKLPCHNYSVEITERGDQYAECPECHSKFLITWSPVNKKLYSDGKTNIRRS